MSKREQRARQRVVREREERVEALACCPKPATKEQQQSTKAIAERHKVTEAGPPPPDRTPLQRQAQAKRGNWR